MSVTRRVRKIYEDHPYPTVDDRRRDPRWLLPPLDWITDLWRPVQPFPARILAAGCGTGNEVFALRKQFPKSEIVGIDFCPSSIATARKLQRAQGLGGIRFVVGDLGKREAQKRVCGRFDFICCHGMLSYVPRHRVALQNLAHWLAPNGALYLGVNGSAHFSTRWRLTLSDFGFDVSETPNDKRLAKVLALLDSLTREGIGLIMRCEPSFLPTDLFGPFIRTSSLREWIEECRRAGLHFAGTYAAGSSFRRAVNNESYMAFMPRSRAEVAQIVDALCPTQFHRLLLTKRPAFNPPWDKAPDLTRWRPILAPHLRDHRLPKRRDPWNATRTVKLKSRVLNTHLELVTKEWIAEVLRQSQGEMSLGDILAKGNGSIRNSTLRKQLFLLHQLYILNFVPPTVSRPRQGAILKRSNRAEGNSSLQRDPLITTRCHEHSQTSR